MDSVRLIATAALLCLTGCASPAPEPAEPAPQEQTTAEPKELTPDADSDAAPTPRRLVADPRQQTMRINIDVEGVDLADVMEQIGRQVGVKILVDPNLKETVTVSLREIPWREAVEVIAKMTRTEVLDQPGGALLLTQP